MVNPVSGLISGLECGSIMACSGRECFQCHMLPHVISTPSIAGAGLENPPRFLLAYRYRARG